MDFSEINRAFAEVEQVLAEIGELYAIFLLSLGVMQCFFGYRLMRFMIALCGFLAGGVVSAVGAYSYALTQFEILEQSEVIMIGLIGGTICGLLANAMYLLGIFLLCSGGCFAVGLLFLESMDAAAVCGVILGIMGVIMTKPIIIISTSISGGRLSSMGLSLLMGSFENQTMFSVIFAAVGIFIQFSFEKKAQINGGNGPKSVTSPEFPNQQQMAQVAGVNPLQQAAGRENPQQEIKQVGNSSLQIEGKEALQKNQKQEEIKPMFKAIPMNVVIGFEDFFKGASENVKKAYEALQQKDSYQVQLALESALSINLLDPHGNFMKIMLGNQIYSEGDLNKIKQPLNQFPDFQIAFQNSEESQKEFLMQYQKFVDANLFAMEEQKRAFAEEKLKKEEERREKAKENRRRNQENMENNIASFKGFLKKHRKGLSITLVAILLAVGAREGYIYWQGIPPDEKQAQNDLVEHYPSDFGTVISLEYLEAESQEDFIQHKFTIETETEECRYSYDAVVSYTKEDLRYEIDYGVKGGVNFDVTFITPLVGVDEDQVDQYLSEVLLYGMDGSVINEGYEIISLDYNIRFDYERQKSYVDIVAEYEMNHYYSEVQQEIVFDFNNMNGSWASEDNLVGNMIPKVGFNQTVFQQLLITSGKMIKIQGKEVVEISASSLVCQENIQITATGVGENYFVTSDIVIDNGICDIHGTIETEILFDTIQGFYVETVNLTGYTYDFSELNSRTFVGAYGLLDREKMGVPVIGDVEIRYINITEGNLIYLDGKIADYSMSFQGTFDPLTGKIGKMEGDSSFTVSVPNFFMDMLEHSTQQATISLEIDYLTKENQEFTGYVHYVGHVKGIALFAGNPTYSGNMVLTPVIE